MAAKAPTIPFLSGSGGGGPDSDEKVRISGNDTLSGYLSGKLVVNANTPIALNILNPAANESLEIELDGDQVNIDWIPTNYTRNATPSEAGDIQDLTAHLKGIDDALASSGGGVVAVTGADTTPDYLSGKLIAAADTPIAFTVLNPGANEDLELAIDGDKLDIDWSPIYYVPDATPAEADDVDDLTAHLKGIDTSIGAAEQLDQRIALESMFNAAYANHYSELTYSGVNVTNVDIWETAAKTTKLFSRVLSYSGINVTSVVTTDEITSAVLTTTMTYTGATLNTVTKVVS